MTSIPLKYLLDADNLSDFEDWLLTRGAVLTAPTTDRIALEWADGKAAHQVFYNADNANAPYHTNRPSTYGVVLAYRLNYDKAYSTYSRGQIDKVATKRYLSQRYGSKCFWGVHCRPNVVLPLHKLTIEHLVPVAGGGGDGSANLVLACEKCNHRLGQLPLPLKIIHKMAKNGDKSDGI